MHFKRERRSASPASRPGRYDSFRSDRVRQDLGPGPFNPPGLLFNSVLRSDRISDVLSGAAVYVDHSDDLAEIVIKNLIVLFRLLMFYRPLWHLSDLWVLVSKDLVWPTAPDWSIIKKIAICNAQARRSFLQAQDDGRVDPPTMTPLLRVLHQTMDRFVDEWLVKGGHKHFDRAICMNDPVPRRDEWARIMQRHPKSLLAPDFDPDTGHTASSASRNTSSATPTGAPTATASTDAGPPRANRQADMFLNNLTETMSKRKHRRVDSWQDSASSEYPRAKRQQSNQYPRGRSSSPPASLTERRPRDHALTLSPGTPRGEHRRVPEVTSDSTMAPLSLSEGLEDLRRCHKHFVNTVGYILKLDHSRTPDEAVSDLAELRLMIRTLGDRIQRLEKLRQ